MGKVYEGAGDIDNAVKEYKKALKLDNEASYLHLSLASGYLKNNDIPRAIEELKAASLLDPDAIEPNAILALLYSSQGNEELAAQEYETAIKKALRLEPENLLLYKSLGMLYLSRKQLKEAQGIYEQIISFSPQDAEAYFYLAAIFNELNNNSLAEEKIKKAIELKPDFHEALNFLGYLYVEEERHLDKAEALIRKALEFKPQNGAYLDSLGWFYFKKGDLQNALEHLKKASLNLNDPVIYEHLGDVYIKLNEPDLARASYQKALELKPDSESVKKKIERQR